MNHAASWSRWMALLALAGTLTACGGDHCVGIRPGYCANDKPAPAAPAAPAVPTDPAVPEAALAAPHLRVTPQGVKSLRFSWNDVVGETGYVLLEDPDGASGFSPVARLPADSSAHELTVFLPARVNARYVLQACKGSGCTDSAAVSVSAQLAGVIGYFKASNAEAGDQFGSVLALSSDGSTLAVAAPLEDSAIAGDPGNNAAADSGAVYLFTRHAGSWQQQQVIKASNPDANDRFGSSLALSADGNSLAVGAPLEDSSARGINGNQANDNPLNTGAAYLFTRTGSSWTQQAYLKASNDSGLFGISVALGGDGRTLAVGAVFESGASTGIDGNQNANPAFINSGAVYVFTRGDSLDSWTQQAYVKASNTETGDQFGGSLALSKDGNTLVVGAQFEDSDAMGVAGHQLNNNAFDSGAAYVFLRSGSSWSQQAYLKASNTAAGNRFGASLSLSADGQALAVGSPREDSGAAGQSKAALDSGAVYVFQRNGSAWDQQALLKASSADASDQFGADVALSPDGATLAVGVMRDASADTGFGGNSSDNGRPESGAVYLFSRQGSAWANTHFLKASNAGAGDLFGSSVALAADAAAPILAVGAPFEAGASSGIGGDQATRGSALSGAVYLY